MFFGSRQGAWRIWLVIGLGLCFYGYHQWRTIQAPDDAELTAAIEAQYESELARMREHADSEVPVTLTPEWQDKFRTAIRRERLAPIEKEKKRAQSLIGGGLLLLVMAAGMFVFDRQAEKQKRP